MAAAAVSAYRIETWGYTRFANPREEAADWLLSDCEKV